MKVSIIVPVYNSEHTLKRCINSIIKQTYSDLEVILVNDGSTDRSLEICNEYQTMDNRVIVLSERNGGPGTAKNYGLKVATGDYVCFVDSDDKLMLNAVDLLLHAIISEKADLAISGYKEIFVNSSRKENVKIPNFEVKTREDVKKMYPQLYKADFISAPWAKMYSMEIIREHDIWFDEVMRCEDIPFNIKYYQFVNMITFIKVPCYQYTVTGRYCVKLPSNYYNIWENIVLMMQEILDIRDVRFFNEILMQNVYICLKTNYKGYWSKINKEQTLYTKKIIKTNSVQSLLNGSYTRWEHTCLKYLLKTKSEKLIRLVFILMDKVRNT